tara:strand:+ start:672 stop:1775 length:1104 start_codon:yes stop_codon:yes gene_type:complete
MFKSVFKDKKILITGHTGFKGSWLSVWLSSLGANVFGLSVSEVSKPSNYIASCISDIVEDFKFDIRDHENVKSIVKKIQPDFIFHLAAQSLVKLSYINPVETYSTNALGTINILNSLRNLEKKVIAIIITSDKAYDNVEWVWGYRETDTLGGKDPYSASKGMAELAIRSFVHSYFNSKDSNVRIGIARAGNVIGGGDWALDRIVPDCILAWANNQTVEIRKPFATRPWQHVLEPLSGYLTLAKELSSNINFHGQAYNFGPENNQNYNVSELINEMSKYWNNIKWNDVSTSQKHVHEAGLLKLNCDKALLDLNWKSSLNFQETVKMTVKWYKEFYQKKPQSMRDFSIKQIQKYTMIANKNNTSWAKND